MVNGSAKCSTDELFLVKKMRNFILIIITFVGINFHSDPETPHCKDKKRATDSLSLSQQPLYISHRRKGLPFLLSLSLSFRQKTFCQGFLENRTQILLISQNKSVLKTSIFQPCFFVCCLRSIYSLNLAQIYSSLSLVGFTPGSCFPTQIYDSLDICSGFGSCGMISSLTRS